MGQLGFTFYTIINYVDPPLDHLGIPGHVESRGVYIYTKVDSAAPLRFRQLWVHLRFTIGLPWAHLDPSGSLWAILDVINSGIPELGCPHFNDFGITRGCLDASSAFILGNSKAYRKRLGCLEGLANLALYNL